MVKLDKQDTQDDLVGSPLTLRTFDHGDHPVEETLTQVGADAHDQPVG